MKKLLSALLIATLLIASVACVFAVAEEDGDNAPIATIELNSGAIYASGSSVILARIGENKTVEQITGYLRSGDAKDLNYFYVYAVVDGVVTAEYETLGRPDGVKSTVEVPENGVLVCISVVEGTTQGLNEKINVGTFVTLEGITIEALSALEPGANIEGAKVSFYEKAVGGNTTTTSSEDDNTTSSEDDNTTSTEDDNTTSTEDNTTSTEDNTTSSTEAGTTTSAPAASSSDAPPTGDNGIIVFAVLAVLAIAGSAIVIRARG